MAEQSQMEMVARMCQTMIQVMQEQNTVNRIEACSIQVLQMVNQRVGEFNRRSTSQFLREFEKEMKLQGVNDQSMVRCFHRISSVEVCNRVIELQNDLIHGVSWNAFKQALMQEYSLDDESRISRRRFVDWVNQQNKGLFILDLFRDFQKRFSYLSQLEGTRMALEKVSLFVQSVDDDDRNDLEILLEDPNSDDGLVTDWQAVVNVCRCLSKRAQRKGKQIPKEVVDSPANEVGERNRPADRRNAR